MPWLTPTLLGLGVFFVAFRLLVRLMDWWEAETCPACSSRQTTLTGEWDGEDWECRDCGHCFVVRPGHEPAVTDID